jgi:hypothetical protein
MQQMANNLEDFDKYFKNSFTAFDRFAIVRIQFPIILALRRTQARGLSACLRLFLFQGGVSCIE